MARTSRQALVLTIVTVATSLMGSARAEIPIPLDLAVKKWIADENHWAYTQTIRRTDKDMGETIERFDPSKPDDEQWTLLKFQGKAPSDEQRRKWRERKARQMRRREEMSLGDLLDLENSRLSHESSEIITYEIPLRAIKGSRLPPDKFRVLMDINKRLTTVEHLDVSLRSSFRMKGVAKVNAVAITCDFTLLDERYAPQPSRVSATGSGRVLGLVKVAQGREIRWADYRRVKPYRDRFDVKLGDLKALGF